MPKWHSKMKWSEFRCWGEIKCINMLSAHANHVPATLSIGHTMISILAILFFVSVSFIHFANGTSSFFGIVQLIFLRPTKSRFGNDFVAANWNTDTGTHAEIANAKTRHWTDDKHFIAATNLKMKSKLPYIFHNSSSRIKVTFAIRQQIS